MNCPFCNKQVKQLALHIKEKHPKKFNFLKKNKPKLYKKLQKELDVYEMLKSKDPSLFILKIDGKKQYFKYNCVCCGQCCHIWEIEIQKEDVDKWSSEGRVEILNYIQIYPQCISVMNLGLIQRLAEIEISNFSLDHITFIRSILRTKKPDPEALIEEIKSKNDIVLGKESENKIKNILEIQDKLMKLYVSGENIEIGENVKNNVNLLRTFILENHNYLGEPQVDRWGDPIKDPTMDRLKAELPQFFDEKYGIFKGKIPHWLLGAEYGPRAILSPKTFESIKEGWKRGLSYYLIYELRGGCGLLEDNLCSIHDYKPIACSKFPYNRKMLDPNADQLFLETCKGLKRFI